MWQWSIAFLLSVYYAVRLPKQYRSKIQRSKGYPSILGHQAPHEMARGELLGWRSSWERLPMHDYKLVQRICLRGRRRQDSSPRRGPKDSRYGAHFAPSMGSHGNVGTMKTGLFSPQLMTVPFQGTERHWAAWCMLVLGPFGRMGCCKSDRPLCCRKKNTNGVIFVSKGCAAFNGQFCSSSISTT